MNRRMILALLVVLGLAAILTAGNSDVVPSFYSAREVLAPSADAQPRDHRTEEFLTGKFGWPRFRGFALTPASLCLS